MNDHQRRDSGRENGARERLLPGSDGQLHEISGNSGHRGLCENLAMKRALAATVWRKGKWYVAQCLEVDVASQGETEEDALTNLKEAVELHLEPPHATRPPAVRTIEVEVGAA